MGVQINNSNRDTQLTIGQYYVASQSIHSWALHLFNDLIKRSTASEAGIQGVIELVSRELSNCLSCIRRGAAEVIVSQQDCHKNPESFNIVVQEQVVVFFIEYLKKEHIL